MDAEGIDAVVLAQPANVRYFTGLRTWLWALPPRLPILAVLPRDAAAAAVVDVADEADGVVATTWLPEPGCATGERDPVQIVRARLERLGVDRGRVALELGAGQRPHIAPADLDRLRACLPHARWADAGPLVQAVRALKSGLELGRLRDAAAATRAAFAAVHAALVEGVSEVALTGIAARAAIEHGATVDVEPLILIFASGPGRFRQPLQPPTDRDIRRGELISLDGGCTSGGYHADFARCAVIGELSDAAAEAAEITEWALAAAVRAIAPGHELGCAWQAAHDVLVQAGIADCLVNAPAIGHGIGLEHWELPRLEPPGTEAGRVRARPGMTLCVEPQVAGAFGDTHWNEGLFLIEDEVLVTPDGAEVLTPEPPRDVFRA